MSVSVLSFMFMASSMLCDPHFSLSLSLSLVGEDDAHETADSPEAQGGTKRQCYAHHIQ